MASSHPPDNPTVNDAWVDDSGDLYTWDGKEWVLFADIPGSQPDRVFREEK
jgi:hypothetical protein